MKNHEILDFYFKEKEKQIEVVLFKYTTNHNLVKAKINRALKQAPEFKIKYS
jgi:hypothetical protein